MKKTPWKEYLEKREKEGRGEIIPDPQPESDWIMITEGPDYPLSFLMKLARERKRRTGTYLFVTQKRPLNGGSGKPKRIRDPKLRCKAHVPARYRTGPNNELEGHQCHKRAFNNGFCYFHQHLIKKPECFQKQILIEKDLKPSPSSPPPGPEDGSGESLTTSSCPP